MLAAVSFLGESVLASEFVSPFCHYKSRFWLSLIRKKPCFFWKLNILYIATSSMTDVSDILQGLERIEAWPMIR